ncbi:DNA excision repair protein Ercc1 [Brevipalpus obovatus]|uniref:DNA excision repair protein Ercc1 n=1 Tax=Brevipalpus obovatus TaxID=246614 RepID=UPI003D9F53B9
MATDMVQVHSRQKNTALLSCIKSIKWTFAEIPADFVIAQNMCALVLSLKYHNQYPNYIYDRMQEVGKNYQIQILVVIVDISDPNANLKELAKVCIMADFTLMCCWSVEEAARIIEQYKMSEKKSPASLMADQLANINGIGDKNQCVREALTCIKSVNKTDALQLVSNFESLEKIVSADADTLAMCPGLGPQKAERLYKAFHAPFVRRD